MENIFAQKTMYAWIYMSSKSTDVIMYKINIEHLLCQIHK